MPRLLGLVIFPDQPEFNTVTLCMQLDLHGLPVSRARRLAEEKLQELRKSAQAGGIICEVGRCSKHTHGTVVCMQLNHLFASDLAAPA